MFWGKLSSINLYDCDSELIKNKRYIRRFIKELVELIKMVRYGRPIVKRLGKGHLNGVSGFQFIETSSITLHFDETKNRAFIDIFSCKDFNEKQAEKFSKQFFKAKTSKNKILIRE